MGLGETYAKEYGNVMDRSKWRINTNWHIAPTRAQAIAEDADGLLRWHNEYNVDILGRPNTHHATDGLAMARRMAESDGAIIGTPDDAVEAIARLQKRSGGFGTLVGFAHDWAPREAQLRSFEMFARYVIPRVHGLIVPVQRSADFVAEHKGELMEAAGQAVLTAIRTHNASHPREGSTAH